MTELTSLQITILDFNEHSNSLDPVAIYSHADEVWAIDTSPTDSSLMVTCAACSTGSSWSRETALWRLPGQSLEDIEDSQVEMCEDASRSLIFLMVAAFCDFLLVATA